LWEVVSAYKHPLEDRELFWERLRTAPKGSLLLALNLPRLVRTSRDLVILLEKAREREVGVAICHLPRSVQKAFYKDAPVPPVFLLQPAHWTLEQHQLQPGEGSAPSWAPCAPPSGLLAALSAYIDTHRALNTEHSLYTATSATLARLIKLLAAPAIATVMRTLAGTARLRDALSAR
jgi:hypothetical protein